MYSKKITLLFHLFVLLFFSCGKQEQAGELSGIPEEPENISSPVDFSRFISSYSAGILSKESGIEIVLSDPLSSELTKNQLNQLFTFEPNIKGSASLADPYTIRFTPEEPLPSGQFYKVDFAIGKIRDVPPDLALFQYNFSTIKQDLEVSIDRIEYHDGSENNNLTVYGRIRTADTSENGKIEEILALGGEFSALTWDHSSDENIHAFVIEGIPRKEISSRFNIAWTGSPIGVEREGEESFEIPSKETFRYLSFKQTRVPQKTIQISFSMPLDPEQDTDGLVRLGGRNIHELSIRDNRIILYLDNYAIRDQVLSVSRSVKDVTGILLGRDVEVTIPASQDKPYAEILTDGGILPGDGQFILPMEAVSLRAVDIEIIRVFENNMIQYLQENRDIKGTGEMNRVGIPVAFRTVSLEGRGADNLNVKNRFNLDLSSWIKREPGALYQVRLSFRRSQSLYPCEHNHTEEDDLPLNRSEWDGPSYGTLWDQFYYSDWRNRDNPCFNTYYARRTDEVNLIASNWGIIAKQSEVSDVAVYVTNLLTADPASEADVTLYNYQQQVIGEGVTDASGYTAIKPKGVPFALQASKDGMNSWIRLDDGTALSLSDFEIDGVSVQEGLRGFLYGERGVWRPGDTAHLNFILQDRLNTLPADHPVIFELLDPDGKVMQRAVSKEPVGRIYGFPVTLQETAPTGIWTARVTVGDAVFSRAVRVETVKPNRLKIAMDLPEGDLPSGRQPIGMDVRWLHGAIASNMKTEVEMSLSARPTVFDGYGSYLFDDPTKSFYSPPNSIFSGRIDQSGHADIVLPLSSDGKSSGFLNVNLQSKVFEEGGDFSISTQSLRYSPYDSYVGIRAPAGDQSRGMLLTDEDHILDIVSLDREGKYADRKTLDVEMYKLNWRWWWDKSEEDLSRFVSQNYREALKSESVEMVDGRASWSFRVNYPEWGRYLIRVIDPVSGHSAGKIIYIDWPGWAGAPQRGDSVSHLSFYADKENYTVGENAVITIPSEEGGRILVSLEDGTGIINSWWVDSRAENTVVKFPVESSMSPSVYVHASYLQPYSRTENDLPVRMFGIIPLSVTDPQTKLEPVIEVPPVLEPEQQVKIQVSEKSGKSMAYTLAVVDEGLLDLTNFKTPDPWSSFFARETLGVRTWDLFDDIINAFSSDFGTLLSIGGGDGGDPQPPQKANRFKPVVQFFGPYQLDEGEKETHSFTMPLYVGSVRVMVIAAEDQAYGSAEETVPVRSDLMVLGTLPRVLGPDEKIQIPVNVFSLTDGGDSVKVRINTEGPLSIIGEKEKTLTFEDPSDQYAYFEALTEKKTGPVFISIEAVGQNKRAIQKLELNVRPSNPPDTRIQNLHLESGESARISLTLFGLEDQYSQILEASSLPPVNLEKRLDYLIRYPHGCIEQTVSSIFPQLYLGTFNTLSLERQAEIERNITAGIERLRRFQLMGGGFSYWISQDNTNVWGTNYAGHFLLEAAKAGYHVPEDMIADWTLYQKEAANLWQPKGEVSALNQAYRLYTLALAGEPDMAGMNRLRETPYLTVEAKWKLAAAYQIAGRGDAAKKLIRSLERMIDVESEDTYGSVVRNRAMVLETLSLMGEKREAEDLFQAIASVLGSDEWLSTQSTAYALVSMAAWLGKSGEVSQPEFTWQLNNSDVKSVKGETPYYRLQLPGEEGTLTITNRDKQDLYINLFEKGIPLRGEDRTSSSNLSMSVRYTPKNSDPGFRSDSIESGKDFIMEITVTNPRGNPERENLALEQMLPPGWEIINPRLFGNNNAAAVVPFDYQDIRDDRIYTYFDLAQGESKVFKILLNASYRGTYYQPSVRCEAMYDHSVSAVTAGRIVEVR